MFIIVYRGWDNDLHFIRWEEGNLSEAELPRLWDNVRQFGNRDEAEEIAKKECPFEYEIFEINW